VHGGGCSGKRSCSSPAVLLGQHAGNRPPEFADVSGVLRGATCTDFSIVLDELHPEFSHIFLQLNIRELPDILGPEYCHYCSPPKSSSGSAGSSTSASPTGTTPAFWAGRFFSCSMIEKWSGSFAPAGTSLTWTPITPSFLIATA